LYDTWKKWIDWHLPKGVPSSPFEGGVYIA
jgi:hypothetical protein